MDIADHRQLANATRWATDELPAYSIQWYAVQLAAEVVDPDGRPVDQWTPLWIRATLLDEPAGSQARAILAAIDEDRLTHHRGALRDAYYAIVGTDPPVPNLNQILSYTPTEDGTGPCPACNDSGVLSTMDGETIGPCPSCADKIRTGF